MLTGIFTRRWIELEQLDLEGRRGPLQFERMCWAVMSGMPMYLARAPPSIVATCCFRKPSISKNFIAFAASAAAMVT